LRRESSYELQELARVDAVQAIAEIRARLWRHGGDLASVAREAGMPRVLLFRVLKRLGIDRDIKKFRRVAKEHFRLPPSVLGRGRAA
jgi:hypothetical protein